MRRYKSSNIAQRMRFIVLKNVYIIFLSWKVESMLDLFQGDFQRRWKAYQTIMGIEETLEERLMRLQTERMGL